MNKTYLDVGLEAVQAAEEIILQYFHDGIRYSLKTDRSPVTVADQEAEKAIKTVISHYFPSHGFYGEEFAKENDQADFVWIIDPIDGTRNYVRKIPLFATQLALMHNGELILGISNAPVLHERLYAEKGKGCFCNGKRVSVSKIYDLQSSFLTFGGVGKFQETGHLSHLLSIIGEVKSNRNFGDFWNFHLLAQGKVDSVVEAKTKIWDIAAAKVLVEEAGGKMTDMYGKEIGLTTTTCIATNGLLHERVVEYFR